MGVDPGKRKLHYVVGGRVTEADSHIYDWGYVDSFDEIGQVAKRFNVEVGVMDIGAETHAVRAFLYDHPGWWGCQYVNSRKSGYNWNLGEHVVSAGRTEVLDASHDAIIRQRDSFPAPDETWHDTIVPQLKNLARTKLEDDYTGTITHKWVVTGGVKNDHIKHAHGYYRMALERVGLLEQVQAAMNYPHHDERPRNAMTL
ncbi:MAG: hypothetical protein JRE70_07680 [Deltaproteobacteria bacterium]|nr:hypothetical protein [Deltaproteobacteria bacterium]